jgi:hypothetical protein
MLVSFCCKSLALQVVIEHVSLAFFNLVFVTLNSSKQKGKGCEYFVMPRGSKPNENDYLVLHVRPAAL